MALTGRRSACRRRPTYPPCSTSWTRHASIVRPLPTSELPVHFHDGKAIVEAKSKSTVNSCTARQQYYPAGQEPVTEHEEEFEEHDEFLFVNVPCLAAKTRAFAHRLRQQLHSGSMSSNL
eukprot:TRINITY_DN5022_c0_g1_i4.p1 TRINITY_DN5022_c0_g1~~TRINITY_DN5022_c0_g1_i4.p1  ORF type:complete len:120 (-),score=13.20 TRINITY_DN5022_c0_g1_i4:60-419(-)